MSLATIEQAALRACCIDLQYLQYHNQVSAGHPAPGVLALGFSGVLARSPTVTDHRRERKDLGAQEVREGPDRLREAVTVQKLLKAPMYWRLFPVKRARLP